MPMRFVILHHQANGGEHWDLMLEHGEVLLTWQLLREPVDASSLPIPARRIQDHRKAFLTYEGPLRQDCGQVRRTDRGTVGFVQITETELVFDLHGGRLAGRFRLYRANDDWILTGHSKPLRLRITDPTSPDGFSPGQYASPE